MAVFSGVPPNSNYYSSEEGHCMYIVYITKDRKDTVVAECGTKEEAKRIGDEVIANAKKGETVSMISPFGEGISFSEDGQIIGEYKLYEYWQSKRSADGKGAYKSQIKANDKYNKTAYDRLTVRIASGNRERLLDHMQSMLARVHDLENMESRTEEQEQELSRLKVLYQVSDRGIPSINNLICQLLRMETGIDMQRKI